MPNWLARALGVKALRGDPRAYCALRDTTEGRPAQTQQHEIISSTPSRSWKQISLLTLSVLILMASTSGKPAWQHRLFSFISSNWRGEPLRDYETVVNLIAETTTAKGLTVTCRLDRRKYPTGRKVTKEEMKQVNLHPDKFHGEWNYVIKPHRTQK